MKAFAELAFTIIHTIPSIGIWAQNVFTSNIIDMYTILFLIIPFISDSLYVHHASGRVNAVGMSVKHPMPGHIPVWIDHDRPQLQAAGRYYHALGDHSENKISEYIHQKTASPCRPLLFFIDISFMHLLISTSFD